MKYHYFHRFRTYLIKRKTCADSFGAVLRCSSVKHPGWRQARSRGKRRGASRGVVLVRVAIFHTSSGVGLRCDPIQRHCQAGSLTGAVHLSKNNAGVLRPAQRGQKPRVEQKGKSWLDPGVQYAQGLRKHGLSILLASRV